MSSSSSARGDRVAVRDSFFGDLINIINPFNYLARSVVMPDNDRPAVPPPEASTAVQVRPGTALSTLVLPPVAVGGGRRRHPLPRPLARRRQAQVGGDRGVSHRARHRAGGDDDGNADLPRRRSRSRSSARRPRSSSSRAASSRRRSSGDLDFYRTQYELLKSRTLAERVVEQMNLRQRVAAKKEEAKPWWSGFLRELMGKDEDKGAPAAPPPDARSAEYGGRRRVPRVVVGGADSQLTPGAGVLRLAGPQACRRCAECARQELHRRQSRAPLRRVGVRQDLPRGKARADEGEARGFRARAGRVPARAADHQRRREAERARADVERVQRRRREDQRGAAQGRGAVPGVQGQSRVRAADGREQVDRAVARAADEAAGRVPGPAADLQAGVSRRCSS